jgi:hypothetical protein
MNSDHFLKVEFQYTETKEKSAKQGRDGAEVQDRFLVHNPYRWTTILSSKYWIPEVLYRSI